MNEAKKNDKLLILISALGAAALFLAFCAFSKIAPLGDYFILRNDGLKQYAPFLAEYIERLKGGGSLLYSWNTGLGTNEFASICYYLLSPFNLLALPFNSSNIDSAMLLIITVKTAFIAGSFSYFVKKKFNASSVLCFAFSLLYTFSGFYLAYYYNTMWLDALIALPLIALGIENIVKGKKATLYFFALAYAIIVNFYIAYMICIFCVLYFFLLVFSQDVSKNKDEKQDEPIFPVMLKFGTASLFAGLISAIVIIPVLYALGSTAAKSDFSTTDFFFNLFDFLSYHTDGVNIEKMEMTPDTAPYLMSSMLTMILFSLFFTSKKIKPNEKVATAAVTVLFFLSMQIPKLNYFWHGLNAPSGLPYRFSFLYLFLIITVAFKTLLNIDSVPKWAFVIPVALVGVSVGYAKFSQFSIHFTTYGLVLSAVAAALYLVILLVAKNKDGFKRALPILLCVLVVAELCLSNTKTVKGVENIYDEYYTDLEAVEQVKKIIKADTDGFYRMEISNDRDVINTPALYNYNGISTFSSLTNSVFAQEQYCYGLRGNGKNSFSYSPQTPMYNAINSLGYLYDNDNRIDSDNPYYEKIGEVDGKGVYKVKYALPLAYCVNSEIEKCDPFIYQPYMSQTSLWGTATGEKNAFVTADLININYDKCHAVSKEEINAYYKSLHPDEETQGHVHEDGEEHQDGYEMLTSLIESIGGIYSYKADENGFSISFDYEIKQDGEVFAVAYSGCFRKLTVTSDKGTKEFDVDDKELLDIGYYHAGDKVTLKTWASKDDISAFKPEMPLSDSVQIAVTTVDNEAFMNGYKHILENGTLKIETFKDSYIKGTVNASKDGVMVASMPYDEGWTVTVDGEAVELIKNESHMMMFNISQGEHTVEMKYFPQGLKEGIFVSVASILALALVMLLSKVRKMKAEVLAQEEAEKTANAPEKDD